MKRICVEGLMIIWIASFEISFGLIKLWILNYHLNYESYF